jgi:1-acyl-sn-glycerol-3-phosphate acyltransferase
VEVGGHAVPVQPATIAYRALWGLPLDRRRRPFFAWYGDMSLLSHLWQALAMGPVDVDVIFHPPRTLTEAGGRKALAEYCEKAIRRGLAEALAGDRRTGPVSLWRQAA